MASGSRSTSIESPIAGPKRKSNDVGWDYGVCPDENNLDKIKCTLCQKVVSGGITRLKQHIAHIKGQVASCPKATKDDQLRCRDAINQAKLKKKGKKDHDESIRLKARNDFESIDVDEHEIDDELLESLGSRKEPNVFGPLDDFANKVSPEESLKKGKGTKVDLRNSIRKERIWTAKKYIGRWAFHSGVPFHALENDSFKMMLEVVGQFGTGLPPPTRYELGTPILKEEVERTKSLLKRNEEEWKLNGCSIMTDAWSDRKRRSIMNLCVNSRMGTVFLSSKECSSEAHTSDYIYEYVEGCIQEVGAEHVVQIVTDNASNNMGAAKKLKETRPRIFWTSCATHTINLMLEGIGALPRFKKILDQAKKLTIFIYSHHKTLAMMRDFTKKRDIVRPGVTRFASAFLTLQSLSEKKEQLRMMFSSTEWEESRFFNTVKGKATYATVLSTTFWAGVSLCLKVFSPLVKVLRMVDADWKPSMGFVYGELKNAKEEIKEVFGGNQKAYESIIQIIDKKLEGRLDSVLHLTAYLLNPYYLYKDPRIEHDPKVSDAVLEFVETIYAGDLGMQMEVLNCELPKYKTKMDRFGKEIAITSCQVNNERYDPAYWWGTYGGATPNLKKVAMRILALTSSSSGCERNWSTFEGIHTKKRNRLEASKLNNLVYCQFNSNLMEKNKRRKDRNVEVLLSNDGHLAQEWVADCDEEEEVEVQPGSEAHWEAVGEAMGTDEYLAPRQSSRTTTTKTTPRTLFDEDFESESEEIVYEEGDYESDGAQVIEDVD